MLAMEFDPEIARLREWIGGVVGKKSVPAVVFQFERCTFLPFVVRVIGNRKVLAGLLRHGFCPLELPNSNTFCHLTSRNLSQKVAK